MLFRSQSACWDLRVQPDPAGAGGGRGRGGEAGGRQGGAEPGGRQGGGEGQAAAGGGGGRGGQNQQSPFGAGCGAAGGGGGGGFGGGGAVTAGPYVLPGVYTVSLVVDGKTIESKPLRVNADPDVVLTEVERKKLYDMAMDLHDLQKRATEVANQIGPFNTRVTELSKEVDGKSDIPADVKATFASVSKDLAALAPKFAAPAGGRGGGGGGRGGGPPTPIGKLNQAKNGLMGGMWPTEQTMKAYSEAKLEVPKAINDANALFVKAAALSSSLAKYNVTLTAPTPTKPVAAAVTKSKSKK